MNKSNSLIQPENKSCIEAKDDSFDKLIRATLEAAAQRIKISQERKAEILTLIIQRCFLTKK